MASWTQKGKAMLTREKIIKTAEEASPMFGRVGGFVSTDGEWCRCTTPAKFKVYLEKLGFVVTACYATDFSTAIAETADGYKLAYNGHCALLRGSDLT